MIDAFFLGVKQVWNDFFAKTCVKLVLKKLKPRSFTVKSPISFSFHFF